MNGECDWLEWTHTQPRPGYIEFEERCETHYNDRENDAELEGHCPVYRCRTCKYETRLDSLRDCPAPQHRLITMAMRVSKGMKAHG